MILKQKCSVISNKYGDEGSDVEAVTKRQVNTLETLLH